MSTYTAYLYDGTFEGLLCAIFDTYARKEAPLDVSTEETLQLRLGQSIHYVPTSPAIAERVHKGIVRTCGRGVFEAVRDASLSDHPDKGSIICTFVRYSMRIKCNTLNHLTHPEVEPFLRIHRAVLNERHRMMQFLRFEERQGGVWFAQCNPNANVVPLLMDWFMGRFNTQPFIIYDETHHIAGVYEGKGWYLVQSNEITPPPKTADELLMEHAWKRFYDTVAVEARYNPELRVNFMPKRLWKNIVEVADSLPDKRPIKH